MGNLLSRSQSWHPDHPRIGDVMDAITMACQEHIASEKLDRELKTKREERRKERRRQRGSLGEEADPSDDSFTEEFGRGARGKHVQGSAKQATACSRLAIPWLMVC